MQSLLTIQRLGRRRTSGSPETYADALDPLEDDADSSDLSRNVYCVLGVPIDAVDMRGVLRRSRSRISRNGAFSAFHGEPELSR